MQASIYVIIFLFLIQVSYGQTDVTSKLKEHSTRSSIYGRVTDEVSSPIAQANVSIHRAADSVLIATVLSTKDGNFNIPVPAPSNYFIRITSVGYTTLQTAIISITNHSKDLGTVVLKVDAKKLHEVSVTAQRPTFTQQADRLVVNVQGTALAAGNTAFNVLSKTPGVFVDADGNIQLNGRAGVSVMLDGKLTNLTPRDLRTMLEGMSAENIKNIEIMTNPSAKYDAEGTAGILNINLRKNVKQGMNGSVYAGYNFNFHDHGYAAGGNINLKRGKWNAFINADFAKHVGGREATFTRVFNNTSNTTYFDQTATANWLVEGPPSIRLGADFSLSSRHSIGFVTSLTRNESYEEFLTQSLIGNSPKQYNQIVDANNYNRNRYQNFNANLHWVGKLDSNGTMITTDLDFIKIENKGQADFLNYYTALASGEKTKDFLYTYTPNGYDIYSAKVDFIRPLEKGRKLEFGAKAAQVISDNDFRFYFNNNNLKLDPLRTNYFKYREHIYAAYANWSGRLSKQFTLQTGLRAESTNSLGNSITTGKVTPNNYLNLFPSVFLQQAVNKDYSVNYSYSRRLTRPKYGRLNPFQVYRDPYTYTVGNPYLRPEYTNSLSVTQSYKKIYNLTFNYQYTKDLMVEVPMIPKGDSIVIYTTGNVNDMHSIGITGIMPAKIAKWWDTQNTAVMTYDIFSTTLNSDQIVNKQLFWMLQSNHIIQLPLKLRMELNVTFRGPAAKGLYYQEAMSRVNAGIKKSFLNKKLDVVLNANDIFKGWHYNFSANHGGNINEFDQYLRWRNVGITLRYNFSKGLKVDSKRNTNSLEEANRL